jgi:7 transmembrane receptor (rhodopsin family)
MDSSVTLLLSLVTALYLFVLIPLLIAVWRTSSGSKAKTQRFLQYVKLGSSVSIGAVLVNVLFMWSIHLVGAFSNTGKELCRASAFVYSLLMLLWPAFIVLIATDTYRLITNFGHGLSPSFIAKGAISYTMYAVIGSVCGISLATKKRPHANPLQCVPDYSTMTMRALAWITAVASVTALSIVCIKTYAFLRAHSSSLSDAVEAQSGSVRSLLSNVRKRLVIIVVIFALLWTPFLVWGPSVQETQRDPSSPNDLHSEDVTVTADAVIWLQLVVIMTPIWLVISNNASRTQFIEQVAELAVCCCSRHRSKVVPASKLYMVKDSSRPDAHAVDDQHRFGKRSQHSGKSVSPTAAATKMATFKRIRTFSALSTSDRHVLDSHIPNIDSARVRSQALNASLLGRQISVTQMEDLTALPYCEHDSEFDDNAPAVGNKNRSTDTDTENAPGAMSMSPVASIDEKPAPDVAPQQPLLSGRVSSLGMFSTTAGSGPSRRHSDTYTISSSISTNRTQLSGIVNGTPSSNPEFSSPQHTAQSNWVHEALSEASSPPQSNRSSMLPNEHVRQMNELLRHLSNGDEVTQGLANGWVDGDLDTSNLRPGSPKQTRGSVTSLHISRPSSGSSRVAWADGKSQNANTDSPHISPPVSTRASLSVDMPPSLTKKRLTLPMSSLARLVRVLGNSATRARRASATKIQNALDQARRNSACVEPASPVSSDGQNTAEAPLAILVSQPTVENV